MSERQFFDDHNLIHVYTRAQAIADGVLHDVTATARECGFLIPVAITDTIWSRWVEASPVLKEYGQSTDARLRDLLVVLHLRIRQLPKDATPSRLTFKVLFLVDPVEGKYEEPELTADCGPGDSGEPVITVLLPEFDD